jgi:hypothetical protein
MQFDRITNPKIIKISFVAPLARVEAVLNSSKKINPGSKKIKIDLIDRLIP